MKNSKKGTQKMKKIHTLIIFLAPIFILFFVFVFNIVNVRSKAAIGDIEKGLIGHWPLNGTYDTKDITPYANHGVNNGASLSTGIKGEANGSYDFGTVNDGFNINIPNKNFSGLYDFSMSAWIYIKGSQLHYDGAIISSGNWNNSHWAFSITQDNSSIRTRMPDANIPYPFVLNTWYNVVYIRQGTSLKFYVNGNLIGTSTNANYIPLASGYTNTKIGMDTYTSNYFNFNGKIADVRIYNRALTADNVKFLYQSYKPSLSASTINKGLIAYYPLNSKYEAKDVTPNANNGVINGATLTTGRMGEINGAYSFNGTSNYISVAHNNIQNLNSNGSIIVWVRSDKSYPSDTTSTNFRGIISKTSNGGSSGISYYIDWYGTNTTRYLRAQIGDGSNTKGIVLSNFDFGSSWRQLAFTFDQSNIILYIDGVLAGQTSNTISAQSLNTSLDIGKAFKGSSYVWSGAISDIKIYNRALSNQEIKTLYDSYKPELSTGSLNKGLVLNMPLTTKYLKSSSIVADTTPYAGYGILLNSPTVSDDGTIFTGVSDSISMRYMSQFNIRNAITISAWIKRTTNYDQLQDLHILSRPPSWYFYDSYNSGYIRGEVFIDGVRRGGVNVPVPFDSNWYNIVYTYDSATGMSKIYKNGLLYNSVQLTGLSNYLIDSSTADFVNIGGNAKSRGIILNGLKIYNRALSPDEVKLLYDKGRN